MWTMFVQYQRQPLLRNEIFETNWLYCIGQQNYQLMSKSTWRLPQISFYRGFCKNKNGPKTSFHVTFFVELFDNSIQDCVHLRSSSVKCSSSFILKANHLTYIERRWYGSRISADYQQKLLLTRHDTSRRFLLVTEERLH